MHPVQFLAVVLVWLVVGMCFGYSLGKQNTKRIIVRYLTRIAPHAKHLTVVAKVILVVIPE